MAKIFQRNETIICSIVIKDANSDLADPETSIMIDIINQEETIVVNATAMTRDSIGTYHYDYNPASDAMLGLYHVKYTAIDGTRITIKNDSFILESPYGS